MIVLCGKTCSGKNYIRDMLVEQGIEPVVTYTTRPMREGEEQDKTYHFLSKEDFQQKQQEGFFIESTSYHVAIGDEWFYGSRFTKEDDNKVIILNPHGIDVLRKADSLDVTPVVFYLDVSDEILRDRAKSRGDNPIEVERRLKADAIDFKNIYKQADLVIPNEGRIDANVIVDCILSFHENVIQNPKDVKKWLENPLGNKKGPPWMVHQKPVQQVDFDMEK